MDDTSMVKTLYKYFREVESFQRGYEELKTSLVQLDDQSKLNATRREQQQQQQQQQQLARLSKHQKKRKKSSTVAPEKPEVRLARLLDSEPGRSQLDELVARHRDHITTWQRKLLLMVLSGPKGSF